MAQSPTGQDADLCPAKDSPAEDCGKSPECDPKHVGGFLALGSRIAERRSQRPKSSRLDNVDN